MAQLVKNPPAMQETWVWSLGWGDPLGKGKVTYSSILAWRIPWTIQSMGSQRVGHDSLPTKVHLVKAMVYPIVMYGYESWTIEKAECWIIDAFKMWCWRRRLKCLGLQGDPTINPKGNQSWIFIGRTDDEAETPILWPPDVKNWLIGKDPDAGRDWRWEEKGTTEDEMVGWQHWRDGHEFEQAPGAGEGQGGLVCCSPWGHRVRDDWATELNWF